MKHRPSISPRRIVVATLILVITVAGCDSSQRPTVDEWQPKWAAALDVIPPQSQIGTPPDKAFCDQTLGELRQATGTLLPTPDIAIDDTVRTWIRIAEDAFFDCPPRQGSFSSFDDAYAELDRLQAEVDLVLVADS